MLEEVDEIRVKANANLDVNKKGELGQFFTSSSICIFMASLFNELKGDISLLDHGCGPGSLTAAFTEEVIRRGSARSLELHAIDIERKIKPFLDVVLDKCVSASNAAGIKCKIYPQINDYITAASVTKHDFGTEMYTHCIINPPYKKITSASDYRKILSAIGIEAVNLYAGFVALAIMQLKKQGEMVAIIPRSFCNGPYYLPFRNFIFQHCAIKHVHIFDSRSHAFSEDDVLQENIIIHLVKNGIQESVKITSSPNSDFFFDQESNSVSASDMTVRNIPFESLVNMLDKDKFIHIAANNRDQSIIDRLNVFYTSLNELGISVSTGPVVDFRLKSDLRENIEPRCCPPNLPCPFKWGS